MKGDKNENIQARRFINRSFGLKEREYKPIKESQTESMTNKINKTWEEKIPKLIKDIVCIEDNYDNSMAENNVPPSDEILIDFIRSLLSQARKEGIEEAIKFYKGKLSKAACEIDEHESQEFFKVIGIIKPIAHIYLMEIIATAESKADWLSELKKKGNYE